MTAEQARIVNLESIILNLMDELEAAGNGFGSHRANRIRQEIATSRKNSSMGKKTPQTTPPAAPVEEVTPA